MSLTSHGYQDSLCWQFRDQKVVDRVDKKLSKRNTRSVDRIKIFFMLSLGYAVKTLLGRYGKTNYYVVKSKQEEVRTKQYIGFRPFTKHQNTLCKLQVDLKTLKFKGH